MVMSHRISQIKKAAVSIVLLSWWFVVIDTNGSPMWRINEIKDEATCNLQRDAYIKARQKTQTPDLVLGSYQALPCSQKAQEVVVAQ